MADIALSSIDLAADHQRVVSAVAGGQRRPALVLGLIACSIVLIVVVAASIAVGSKPISLSTVRAAIVDFDPANNDHVIVRSLRVPRTVLGLLVGVALGLSGAVMQGLTRNPLADPGILGVNAGAALAVVVAIYVFGVSSLLGYVWFALAGAAAASVLVYVLGAVGGRSANPVRLALSGAAVTALLGSITTGVLLVDLATLDQFRFWAVGSLAGRNGTIALQVCPFIIVGSMLAIASGRMLNALALGDDVARSLGQSVAKGQLVSAASVVLLVGGATAAAGPIAFVGLTVPHVARAVTGPDHRWILAYSAVLAPILLLGADVIGRVIDRPAEVQVGIITALLGAPVFIAVVRRRKLGQL